MSLAAIFLASILGSPHCVGMCGGFVALYSSQATANWVTHILYHGARLFSYLALGVVAGAIGGGINATAELAGIQHASSLLLGILMVVLGAGMLLQGTGGLHLSFLPKPVRERAVRIQSSMLQRARGNPHRLAATLGGLSGLLPCGWLYTYVAAAGSTGSGVYGALVMSVFWAGTLPALFAAGTFINRVSPSIRAWLPVTSALLLIGFGFWSLGSHLALFQDGCGCHH